MKRLAAILSGLLLMCACGGGGGGGTPPSAPSLITVNLSPSSQATLDQGQTLNYTAALVGDSGSQGVTFSATGAGCSGSTCGTFTNVTKTTATYLAPAHITSNLNVSVTATSVADATKLASSPVMVTPPPSILTTTLPNAAPTQPYNAALSATGGAGTLSWSLTAGSLLPSGLQLNSAGQIYGTPTVSGTTTFTVKVSDSSSSSGGSASTQQQFRITVVGILDVTTQSLPKGTVGVTYGASIQTSGGTLPINWSLCSNNCPTGGTLPPGLVLQGFNTSAGMVSGTPTAAGTYYFSVTALDSSTPQQTINQPLEIIINPPGPLTITTTSVLDGTLDVPYSATLVATGGTPPISWSYTGGALPTGLALNPLTGVISGTPTATGTFNFSVTATDTTGAHLTQQLTITINPSTAACSSKGNEIVLTGQYAFSLSGYNSSGFLGVVGSFTANGQGGITAGEADTNGVLGAQQGSIIPAVGSTITSFYSVGPDNRGCATIATSFGTFVTRFALGALTSGIATNGRMIEFDTPNPSAFIGTGQILLQNPTDFTIPLNGSFVFHTSGWDSGAGGGRDVCVGVLTAAGEIFSNLDEECNDNGTGANLTGGTGTYTNFDITTGRATSTELVGTGTSHYTLYLVSSTQFLMINSDPTPTVSGIAQQQLVPNGGFRPSSLTGKLVFYLSGLTGGGSGADGSLDLVNSDGSSLLSITSYENYLGVWQGTPPPLTLTCIYTVVSNGRVTLNSSGGGNGCGMNPPVIYLIAPNTGYTVDTAAAVDTGSLFAQTGSPFANTSLSGVFDTGLAEVVSQDIGSLSVGTLTLDGSGHVTGLNDLMSTSSQLLDNPIADTYTVNPDGTFTFGSTGSTIVGVVISNSQFVMFDTSSIPTSFPILLLGSK